MVKTRWVGEQAIGRPHVLSKLLAAFREIEFDKVHAGPIHALIEHRGDRRRLQPWASDARELPVALTLCAVGETTPAPERRRGKRTKR